MMALQNIAMLQHSASKLIDITLIAHRYTNKGGNIFTDFFAIQECLVTFDNAAGFQFLDSLQDGRSRQLYGLSDIG